MKEGYYRENTMFIIENIADIHFGKIANEEKLYEDLKNHFIQRCIDKKADLIVINGDTFDSRQLINSKANIYFNKFIRDCVNTGATIIILEGTESHDRHQINSLAHYISDKFFIVNTVTKLNINGFKFLIIPEEYVKDDSYYKEYLNDKYDFVNFHGTFSHTGFGSNNDEFVRKPFIWDWKMFSKNVKYYVVGGHIHQHSVYKNIIYCSSFSRLNFGEEDPKGFVEVVVNDKGKASYEFIENTDAPTFTTILASKLPDDTENLLNNLRGHQENNDYLRIMIDIEDDNKINNIKGFVKNHDNTCIKDDRHKKSKKLDEQISITIEEKQKFLKEKMDDYKGLSFIEITQKIASKDHRTDFTQEEINTILNTKI